MKKISEYDLKGFRSKTKYILRNEHTYEEKYSDKKEDKKELLIKRIDAMIKKHDWKWLKNWRKEIGG